MNDLAVGILIAASVLLLMLIGFYASSMAGRYFNLTMLYSELRAAYDRRVEELGRAHAEIERLKRIDIDKSLSAFKEWGEGDDNSGD